MPWQRGWVVSLEAREREVADGWSFYIFICCKILNISFLIFKPGVCEKNRLRRDHRGAERARLGYRAINAMGGFGGRARTVHSQKDTVRLWLLCQQSFSDGIYKKSKIGFFFFFSLAILWKILTGNLILLSRSIVFSEMFLTFMIL
jgi:hypothetical protein